MNVVPLEKTDLTLTDAAALAKKGTVILTQDGQPFAAIKKLTGANWESLALADNPRFRALIEESRRASHAEKLSLEQVRRELGLKAKSSSSRGKKSRSARAKKD